MLESGGKRELAASVALLGIFLAIESRVDSPLMPLRLFKLRSVATSNVVGILWSAAMFAMSHASDGESAPSIARAVLPSTAPVTSRTVTRFAKLRANSRNACALMSAPRK